MLFNTMTITLFVLSPLTLSFEICYGYQPIALYVLAHILLDICGPTFLPPSIAAFHFDYDLTCLII